MNKIRFFLIGIFFIALFLTTSLGSTINIAHAKTTSCYDGVVMPTSPSASNSSSHVLPVILVHGYFEQAVVWSKWESFLQNKNNAIPFCTVSFIDSDGPCGSAADHAIELNKIVQKVKEDTGQDQVNIVSHSKGGLDARVYLALSQTQDVANLIMIGTPNGGDILANFGFACRPALDDLQPGADATRVPENLHTNYYTIYGDWKPTLKQNCPAVPNTLGINWPELQEFWYNLGLERPNDGIVPASSVIDLPDYIHNTNLGSTHDCHTNLLSKAEFDLAKDVLKPIG